MKTLVGWLIWLVLRVFVWVARKPNVVFREEATGAPYLRRWPIWTREPWPNAKGQTGGEGWYLHEFLSSDFARELHSHPAAYAVAFVLRVGYLETRRQLDERDGYARTKWCGPGTMNVITSETFHRVTLMRAVPELPDSEIRSWSLFYIGPRFGKSWGFLQADGTVKRAPHNDGNTGERVAREWGDP